MARKLILYFGALAAHVAPVFVHVQGRAAGRQCQN